MIFDTAQLWLRALRVWNTVTQEFDYSKINVKIYGDLTFDFNKQSANDNPGVGLAIQTAGVVEVVGMRLATAGIKI